MKRTRRVSPHRVAGDGYLSLRSIFLALAAGVLIGVCGVVIDHVVHGVTHLYASDIYTALLGFLLSYVLLVNEDRRRAHLARRMHIAADVNHHIRNALTGVVFSAAVRNDPALQAVLQDATARIDWVLNTVLPDGISELQWPVQAEQWSPSSWKKSE